MGVHDLATNTVHLQNGIAPMRQAPRRIQLHGHAHRTELAAQHGSIAPSTRPRSRIGKGWASTLNAVRFAFYVLNEQFADRTSAGAKVRSSPTTPRIASSVSNRRRSRRSRRQDTGD
jgi:hypothetical protein